MKTSFNLTIKTKFYLFLGITIAAFIVIFGFFVYTLNKVQNYRDFSKQVDNVFINILEMKQSEQQFMLKHKEDALFFKTNENKNLKRFDIAYNTLLTNLSLLKANNFSAELELNEHLNKLNENISNYHEIFHEITKATFQRGSSETGIIGEMKRSVKLAQTLSKSAGINGHINQLRQSEKLYLAEKEFTNYNNFIKTFAALNKYINQNRGELTNKILQDSLFKDSTQYLEINARSSLAPAFIKSMNDYKRNFLALVKLDKEIGMNSEDGLSGELKIVLQKSDADVERILRAFNESKENIISGAMNTLYIFVFFALITFVVSILQLSKSVNQPLEKLKGYLQPLSKGILPDELLEMKGHDELSKMTRSINELIAGLKKTTSFATTIGKGVFNTEFTPLSEQDNLGNSLIEMRKNLLQAQKEEEKRKYEDSLRKWANEGLAKFSEIMRQSTNNIESLASNVIKNLVNFLDSNQGGLFLLNDLKKDDIHLELIAAYAYNQERRKKKKIYIGEGLVGMCAVEKASIYMTEIPNDYLTITSGLGGSNPRSLLIVPLKVEEQIFGVVEIASFNRFEKHEIEFVEKVSESIASTLSIAKINARTAELLEQSQQQAEEMAAQEEEMRKNLEELQATQEESARREAEMISILNAINASSLVVEFDLNGKIIEVNNAVCELFDLSREQMIGRMQGEFEDMDQDKIKSPEFWERLRIGETIKETHHIHLTHREAWLHEIYSPIVDSEGRPYKILNLATDITEAKRQEKELMQQAEIMAAQEEELRQNLEELQATQDEMHRKQVELEQMNVKLLGNEKDLQNSLQTARDQEMKIQQKNTELTASEEELRQNMEELQATQEEIERQHSELQQAKEKLEANEAVLKKAIEKSRSNETKFKLIIDNLPETFLVVDSEGTINQSNAVINKLTGYNIGEVIGLNITKLFVGFNLKNLKEGYKLHAKTLKKDGTSFIAGGIISDITVKEKQFVIYFSDITQDLQKEQDLITTNELALKYLRESKEKEQSLNEKIAQLEEQLKMKE